MPNELKPCPFCGGEAAFFAKTFKERGISRGWGFGIFCTNCAITSPKTNYQVEITFNKSGEIEITTDERPLAIKEWNRRADNG